MENRVRYIQEGNTVRKVYEFPEREEKKVKKVTRQPESQTGNQEAQALVLGLKMTLLLAVSVFVSVLSCINYLDAQADITKTKNNIAALQTSIETLTTRNDSVEYEIDSFVDVEYITKVAKEELGMVMVQEEQVISYESTRNEYMEQYGDVPAN